MEPEQEAARAQGTEKDADRPRGDGWTRDALEQLREILFGAAQREVDRRLRRIDAHLSAKTHDVEAEVKRRTDLLDAHFRREIDALASRYDSDGTDARESVRALAREHREAMSALEQRIARLEESQLRAHRELRDRILEQAKASIDEVRRVREELSAMVERELGVGDEPDEEPRGAEPPRAH